MGVAVPALVSAAGFEGAVFDPCYAVELPPASARNRHCQAALRLSTDSVVYEKCTLPTDRESLLGDVHYLILPVATPQEG
jgi:hypothetical protein